MMAFERDLIDNHDGYLSETQRQMLRGRATWRIVGYGIVSFIVCFFIVKTTLGPVSDRLPWLGLAVLVTLVFIWSRWRDFSNEITEGRVDILAGPVDLRITEGKVTQYSLTVDGRTFQITAKNLLSFKNGDPYLVYITPRTKLFLSAEPLNQDEYVFEPIPYDPEEAIWLGDDGELVQSDSAQHKKTQRKQHKHHR
jgi:hypothetical protein